MSHLENVESFAPFNSAWERGDLASAEWAHLISNPVIADGPSPTSSNGLGGMARTHRNFLTAWEDWRVKAEEYGDPAARSRAASRRTPSDTPSTRWWIATRSCMSAGWRRDQHGANVAARALGTAGRAAATRRRAG